jgi:hypothetical protein
MTAPDKPGEPKAGGTTNPYEATLGKVVERLNVQEYLFVLAIGILLIGLGVLVTSGGNQTQLVFGILLSSLAALAILANFIPKFARNKTGKKGGDPPGPEPGPVPPPPPPRLLTDDCASLQRQLGSRRSGLNLLQEQRAQFGVGEESLALLKRIEAQEREIRQLEEQLRRAGCPQ